MHRQEYGGHLSKGYTCGRAHSNQAPTTVTTVPAPTTVTTVPAPAAQARAPAPPLNVVVQEFTIWKLLQRRPISEARHRVVDADMRPGSRARGVVDADNTYNLYETQDAFVEYCSLIREQYSDDFWRMLSSVYEEKTVTIDRVLHQCHKLFTHHHTDKLKFAGSV